MSTTKHAYGEGIGTAMHFDDAGNPTETVTVWAPPDGVPVTGPGGLTVTASTAVLSVDATGGLRVPALAGARCLAADAVGNIGPCVRSVAPILSLGGNLILLLVFIASWRSAFPPFLAARREIRRLRGEIARLAGELARKGPTRAVVLALAGLALVGCSGSAAGLGLEASDAAQDVPGLEVADAAAELHQGHMLRDAGKGEIAAVETAMDLPVSEPTRDAAYFEAPPDIEPDRSDKGEVGPDLGLETPPLFPACPAGTTDGVMCGASSPDCLICRDAVAWRCYCLERWICVLHDDQGRPLPACP